MNSVLAIIWIELRSRRWAILWWSLALVAYIVLNISVYGSVKDQSAALGDVLKQLPTTVKDLFSDSSDWTSPVGYLSSKVYYLMLPLLFSILGIGLGSSLISREEQSHMLELLLARPVSRGRLLTAKALAGLLVMFIVASVTVLSLAVSTTIVSIDVPLLNLVNATLLALLVSLVFATLAFMLAAMGHGYRSAAVGVSSLVALGGYVLVSLAQNVTWLDSVKIFTPYYYYHPSPILEGHFTPGEATGLAVVTLVLFSLAWVAFRRRDLD